MRWGLTWEDDEESFDGCKAKARIVILGFQDPDLCERPSAAPTASRLARMVFLQVAVWYCMILERADAKTTFLQGRPIERDLFVLPAPELAHALGIPPGEAAKLQKSSYGLVDAPLEWYLHVVAELKNLGWRQLESYPCTFMMLENGQDVALHFT